MSEWPILAWWDFRDLGNLAQAIIGWLDDHGPRGLAYVVSGLLGVIGLLLFIIPNQLATNWIERRVIGRIQARLGPNRVGPLGLLQPIADAVKVLLKEAITPRYGDRWVFWLAPALVFVPSITAYAVIPFGPKMVMADLNVGVLFIVALGSINTLIIFMAGWGSNNKYSLLGAMREIAMMVSYEIPQVLALLGVVLLTGTMSLNGIVQWQEEHHALLVFLQPLAFIFFFIASLVELNRTPADIAEAESEIVAGYHTEYSGFKFAVFYAAEYTAALAVAAITATLFFGGWWLYGINQWVPGWLILIGKIYVFFFVMIWLRGTLPRFRIDQLMAFGWKFMVPLALINIFVIGLEVLIWQQADIPAAAALAVFAIVNIVLAVVLLVGWARLLWGAKIAEPRRVRLARTVGESLAEIQP